MNHDQRTEILRGLAEAAMRRRMATPARLLLDIIAPVGFLAGQAALFIRPLVPRGRWHTYLTALSDEQGWQVLHQLIDQQDC
ncbi:MAG: hypothetical protein U0Z44_12595 [Kouleothrix sp.]|jgi:hypothetical protein|nr:hypothetical protein [Kouleothrix sp.]